MVPKPDDPANTAVQPEAEETLNRAVFPDAKYETPPSLVQSTLGKLYIVLLLVAALVDMMVFILPVKVLGGTIRRRMMAWIEGHFFAMMAGLLELVAGMRMVITTEADEKLDFKPNEHVLLLANHRTEVDWVFFWNFAMRFGFHDRIRVMMKAVIRYVPGPGWAMLLLDFPFVNRNWATDQKKIKDQMHRYRQVSNPSTWMAMFPEGTTLCDSTLEKSREFARSRQAPEWSYVLFPRVRGFELCVEELDPEYVVDLSMAYPELCDGVRPSPLRFFRGQIPREVHIHVRRFHREEMRKHKNQMSEWVTSRFAEKEELLKRFYEDGCFTGKTLFTSPHQDTVIRRGVVGLTIHLMLLGLMAYLWLKLPLMIMSTWFVLAVSWAMYEVKTF